MKNSTYIALILDRSGSIESCLASMQSALDEFVNAQKKEPGECEFMLVQFDDRYDVVYDGPIAGTPRHTIAPRGSTALHDAMGRTIDELGKKLSQRPEHERPERVLICTITDGYENASQFESAESVGRRVTHQRDRYKWNFMFLGANQDAVLTAQTLHIPKSSSMTFATTAAGMAATSGSASCYAASYRSAPTLDMAQSVSFSEDDRKNAMGGEESKTTTSSVVP